jgi:WD40 repeat protein
VLIFEVFFYVSFNPSNPTLLVSGSSDCTVRLWDVGTGKELKKLEGHR